MREKASIEKLLLTKRLKINKIEHSLAIKTDSFLRNIELVTIRLKQTNYYTILDKVVVKV